MAQTFSSTFGTAKLSMVDKDPPREILLAANGHCEALLTERRSLIPGVHPKETVRALERDKQVTDGNQVPPSLPPSMYSFFAIFSMSAVVISFVNLDAFFQKVVLASLLSIWVLLKTYAVTLALKLYGGSSASSEHSGSNWKQRVFRRYYLWDQCLPLPLRGFAWFSLLSFFFCSYFYAWDASQTLASLDWQRRSFTTCHSQACCHEAKEMNWELDKFRCDSNSKIHMITQLFGLGDKSCVVENAQLFQDYCQASAEAGLYSLDHLVHSLAGDHWFAIIMTILFIYRFHSFFFLWLTPLPEKPEEKTWRNDPQFLARIGAVIPCHMSAAEISQTVESILQFLPPENIVVVDNSNHAVHPDNTEEVVRSTHPDVQYIYVPVGLKTLALYTGMKQLPDNVEYIMHMDDDTVLPPDFVFDETWFEDPDVSEVTWPIFTRKVNVLTECIGLQFKLQAHNGWFHNSTSGTALWAAGIVGLVRRKVFETVLPDHVFLPFGEDCFHGFLQLFHNFKIKREARSNVVTFAPPVFSVLCGGSERDQGYGACSLFKQRAQRWMVTKMRRFMWMVFLLLTYNAGSLYQNVWFRICFSTQVLSCFACLYLGPVILVRALYDLLFSSQRLELAILLVAVIVSNYALEVLVQSLINCVLWKHRPDFQVSSKAIFFMPVVKAFLHICQAIGNWLCLFYWMAFVPTRVWLFTHDEANEGQDDSSEETIPTEI